MNLPDTTAEPVKADRKATLIGWQGLTVRVPKDWSFAAYSGDAKSGYFRVESPASEALEVKWSEQKGRPLLRRVLGDFRKRLFKDAKRSKLSVEFAEKPRPLSQLRFRGAAPITFRWKTNRTAYGALWYCEECRRVTLAQVVGTASQTLGPLAFDILSSIEDHPAGDKLVWSVYDFTFQAPKDMLLEKHQLQSGHILMELQNKRDKLVVERWGLANLILKRDTPSGWLSGALYPHLKPFKYTKDEEAVHIQGHAAVVFRGRMSGIRWLTVRLKAYTALRRPMDRVFGYGWHCPESNRVFAALAMSHSAERAENLASSVVESISCH